MKIGKLWIGMLLLLAGCQQEVTDRLSDGTPVTVEIGTCDIDNYADGSATRSAQPVVQPCTFTLPYEGKRQLRVSLEPETPVRKEATTRAFPTGMTFRLIAQSAGQYVAHADYVYTSFGAVPVSSELKLATGKAYTFIAYSYGNAQVIKDDATATSLPVSGDGSTDFLVWKSSDITLVGPLRLDVVFSHLMSRISLQVDPLMGSITTCKARVNGLPESGTWNWGAETITPTVTSVNSDFSWDNMVASANTSLPIGVLPFSARDLTLSISELTVSGTVFKPVTLPLLNMTFLPGVSYLCRVTVEIDAIELGTANSRANCYVVTEAGRYRLDATVKGNGKVVTLPANHQGTATSIPDDNMTTIAASEIASAEVLWETANTLTAPDKGTIVKNVIVSNGMVTFTTGDVEGNAVIAVKNSAGTILWSWHIWRTDEVPVGMPLKEIKATDGTVLAAEGALKLMDRNLGALSNVPYLTNIIKGNLTTGLLYQWGRKDPMPGAAVLSYTSVLMATTPGGIPVYSGYADYRTPQQSAEQPTTLIAVPNFDWCKSANGNLWGCPMTTTVTVNNGVQDYTYSANPGAKTIYDPCPAGWRMAPGYVFANANATSHPWGGYGRDLVAITNLSSGSCFLPAAGSYDNAKNTLNYVGSIGYYWTASPHNEEMAKTAYFTYDSVTLSGIYKSTTASVRCIRE